MAFPIARQPVAPVVKWAGGKKQLLAHLAPLFPQEMARYHEPFLGGGAVFFYLAPLRQVSSLLSDLNEELITFYRVLRDDTEALLDALREVAEVYWRLDEEAQKVMYYRWREADRDPAFQEWSPLRRAVRFYFLNKTGYNGLYRLNQRGWFNVPWGRHKKPAIYAPQALREAASILGAFAVRLDAMPFEEALDRARPGDFVYLDPPYVPLSSTANFTTYTREGFGLEDQARLAQWCRELDRRGVRFLLSNSDTPQVREWYAGFRMMQVQARRSINSKARSRGPVPELVVWNYEV